MGIISVQMPERDDPLARVAKAMNIAQSVFGIKSEIEQAKIRKVIAQQEKIKAENAAMEARRRSQGLMNQEELDQQYTKNVGPDTPGATWTYIDEAVTDPNTRMRLLNPDGTQMVERKVKWYIPKGNLQGENAFLQNTQEEIKVNQLKALENGYVTPGMLANKALVGDYSTVEKPGYRQSKLVQGGVESPIWIMTPQDLELKKEHDKWQHDQQKLLDERRYRDQKDMEERISREKNQAVLNALRKKQLELMQDRANQEKNPIFKMGPDTIRGYISARERGIANPTVEEAYQLNPAKVSKDVEQINDEMLQNKVLPVLTNLEKINTYVGGIDNDNAVPGYGTATWAVASKVPEGIARGILTREQSRLKSAIDALMSDIRLMKSGQAVSKSEQEILDRVLGTNLFSDSRSLKDGLRNVRDVTKTVINTILNKDKPSVEEYLKRPNSIRPDTGVLKGAAIKSNFSPKTTVPFPGVQNSNDRGREAIKEELGE